MFSTDFGFFSHIYTKETVAVIIKYGKIGTRH